MAKQPRKSATRSEGDVKAKAGTVPTTPAEADAGVASSAAAASPAAADAPAPTSAQGIHNRERVEQGGAGGVEAGPAGTAAHDPSPASQGEVGGAGANAGPVDGILEWPLDAPQPATVDAWLKLQEMDAEDVRRRFPLLGAAFQDWTERAGSAEALAKGPVLRITALRDGFRRGGRAHSVAPAEYGIAAFTPEQVEQLLAEPQITVVFV